MTGLVALDLDGTLVDTPAAIVEALSLALETVGAAPCDPSDVRATIGLPLERACSTLMGVPADDDLVARGVREYQALFAEVVLPKASQLLFPGVVEGLGALRRQGALLAVATSKIAASAAALLSAAGIADRFDAVVCADQVARPKPHPDTGLALLRRFGLAPEQAVMVGDTTHDVLMAHAAGMRSIAVTYGVHGEDELTAARPTWLARSFGEVVELLGANTTGSARSGTTTEEVSHG